LPDAFICDAVRTPFGRYGGALASVRAADLAAVPLTALMERNPSVDWTKVDGVIFGRANQASKDNRNVARMAVLLSGLPIGNRSVNSIMFRKELEDIKNVHFGRFNVIHVLESDAQDADLFCGRIDAEKCTRLFQSCAPPASLCPRLRATTATNHSHRSTGVPWHERASKERPQA
jgi:Thiolase, N-terminal domain